MTQKDKELLLRDLSARLPYGVKIKNISKISKLTSINTKYSIIVESDEIDKNFFNLPRLDILEIEVAKPYLFPMSSMTEEQEKEFDQLLELELKAISDGIDHTEVTAFEIDFYNKHHLDWRGLIKKGLAIDATGLNIY